VSKGVLAHVLLFNSVATHGENTVRAAIASLHEQEGFVSGENLQITVTDNGSEDAGIDPFKSDEQFAKVTFRRNKQNLGFSAAQNKIVAEFLKSDAAYLLLLNPDCVLDSAALALLVESMRVEDRVGSACPKLLKLDVEQSQLIDSTGMVITPALRHFDCGCGDQDVGQYDQDAYVFGASGACVLFAREFVEDLIIPQQKYDSDLFRVFPELAEGKGERVDFFDEGFFAYREDADLAWRGQLFNWRCRYVAAAVGHHRRVVEADNRGALSPTLNLHGVRNRFLLQWNNFMPADIPQAILPGIFVRNLLVIVAVMIKERSSLPAFSQCFTLFKRARARRMFIVEKAGEQARRNVARWFKKEPYREVVE
jgi:GT2 family glycosyltransferase